MTRQPRGLRATFLRHPFDRRPPGRGHHGRKGKQRQQNQRRMNGHQQRDRHAQPQNPAAGREHRHVHVIEHEHLVAQDRQPIEIFGALLVRDRRDGRLKPRHVRFQRDRDLVSEPPLHTGADGPQDPGSAGGHAQANRGGRDEHR
jgi:hypothetical protein